MSHENPRITPEAAFPLRTWLNALPEEDRNIIEVDIFNNNDAPPLEATLEAIKDQELARSIMRMFKDYAAQKKSKAFSNVEAKDRAKEIALFVTAKFDDATLTKED